MSLSPQPEPAPAPRPLRVGLLLDSYEQPAWVYQVLEEIARAGTARPVLCIEDARPSLHAPRSPWQRLQGLKTQYLLYNAYSRVDRLLNERRTSAFRPRDITPLLDGCDRLPVRPTEGRFTDELSGEDLLRIGAYDLDVLLRFGFRILKGGVLRAARHGVWSYHHDDNRRYRGGPAGFWEVLRGDPVSGCILQVLSEELDNGRVLSRAFSRTDPLSVRRNQDRVFWHGASMLPRKLAELARAPDKGGAPPVQGDDDPVNLYCDRLYTLPRNREMASLLLQHIGRGAGLALGRLLRARDWEIAYRVDREGELSPTSFFRYRRLHPPPGVFWADPFAVEEDGRHHLFFEEYRYDTGRGRIAAVEIGPDGRAGAPAVVLERPYHLSYPFLFTWEGQRYLMPETRENRTIEVYRCRQFPGSWELHQVLFEDLDAVDATLHQHDDGRWYLFFATRTRGGEDYDELRAYHGPTPLGPFQPVGPAPDGLIKCDVRSARPAGPLLRTGGRLLRPAQVGAPHYGRAVVLQEVLSLSPAGLLEREAARIDPDWSPELRGVHQVSRSGALTAVDLLYEEPRLAPARLRRRLAQLWRRRRP